MCKVFGEQLKKLREERHLTQYQLATHLGYGSSAISNYETGKNEPSLKDLIRLADFFQVSTDYLLNKKNYTQEFIFKKGNLFFEEFFCFYKSLSATQKEYVDRLYFGLKILKKEVCKDNNAAS